MTKTVSPKNTNPAIKQPLAVFSLSPYTTVELIKVNTKNTIINTNYYLELEKYMFIVELIGYLDCNCGIGF